MNVKICHITSAHPRFDNRIFFKECRSLVCEGFRVSLIVADGKKNEVREGIQIIDAGYTKSRLIRMFIITWKILFKALNIKASIYHFHDPELIFTGFLLCLSGKKVIYDIHEDYVASIKQKDYLPTIILLLLSLLFRIYESLFSRYFVKIIAEKYYSARIKNATQVLNYPDAEIFNFTTSSAHSTDGPYNLIYTGNITIDRGAYIHTDIVNYHENINVFLIGRITDSFKLELIERAGSNANRLFFHSSEEYLPFEVIMSYYRKGNWLAGLSIFPETEHYKNKELTKFFEYMLAGVPIIYSNFPVWDLLIGKQNMGVAVNPTNSLSIKNAIDQLITNRDEYEDMRKKCIEIATEKYTWTSQKNILVDLYNKILKN